MKFEIVTPLGFAVRTTESYWELLIFKHPEISGKDHDVQQTPATPDLIRRSRHDPTVHLFYRGEGNYYLCVVAKRLNGEGFIVTAYVTDTMKEGAQRWPTSV